MNNQMPYNYFPQMMPNNDGNCCKKNDNRLDKLENKIKLLERRVTFLENSMSYTPYMNSFAQDTYTNNQL